MAATEVMGGMGARFMWDLVAERRKNEDLGGRYSLIARELQVHAEGDLILGQNPKKREIGDLIPRLATRVRRGADPRRVRHGQGARGAPIHRQSALRDRPLLTLNCTAFTPTRRTFHCTCRTRP